MTKRKNKRGSALDNLFGGGINPYGNTTPILNTPQETQGALQELDIMTVMPDPGQPRDLISADSYTTLFNGTANPMQVLSDWMSYVENGNSAEKQTLTELQQLAQTIQMHGLINPITVRPVKNESVPTTVSYLIRTGERRWWAHVLLTLERRKIKKTQSAERIRVLVDTDTTHLRAEQLVENMARSDLSVIEKARGIEALRQEMVDQRGRSVRWDEVEQLLGISRNYRWRLGKVLELPAVCVRLVAQNNLPERSLRPIVDRLVARSDLQVQAIEQMVIWQEAGEDIGHRRIEALVDTLLREQVAQTPPQTPSGLSAWSAKFGRNLKKSLKLFDELDDEQLAGYAVMVANDRKSAEKLQRLSDHLNRILAKSQNL